MFGERPEKAKGGLSHLHRLHSRCSREPPLPPHPCGLTCCSFFWVSRMSLSTWSALACMREMSRASSWVAALGWVGTESSLVGKEPPAWGPPVWGPLCPSALFFSAARLPAQKGGFQDVGSLVSLCRRFWEIPSPEGRRALSPHEGSENGGLQCVWHKGAGQHHRPGSAFLTPPSSLPLTWE